MGLLDTINLTIVFQRFQKYKLYQYSNVNFLELIERIAELNLIMSEHAETHSSL